MLGHCFVDFSLFEERQYRHSHNTRNHDHLVTMQTKKGYIDNGPLNICIRIFNKVPKEFKALSPHRFKQKLKEYLLTKNFYTLGEFVE